SLIYGQDKGSLDPAYIQKLIRRLGGEHGRTLYIAWALRDGVLFPVHLCLAHCFGFRAVGRHVVTEHLAHASDIGSASSEERGRLKSTHARTVHKVPRIDHNPRIQAV